jgi:AraC-like DNA-binding protein
MAHRQDNLDDRQDFPVPLLELPSEVRGRRYYPQYAAPLSVARFSGACRIESPRGAHALVFAVEGCLRGGGAASPAPLVGPIDGAWTASADAAGWALAFRPEAVNQDLAGWPALPRKAEDDPYLSRDAELLRSILPASRGGAAEGPLLLSAEEALFLRRVFSTMEGLLAEQDDIYWPCRSRSYFLEILYFLWRRPAPESAARSPGPARNARDWMLSHYGEQVSLPDIARALGTNRTSLQELFRAEYGTTVMEYLGDIRVEAATVLMRNTELSLAEIGQRVGYSDYSGFFREFRKRRGDAPSRYRETRLAVRIYP